MKKFLEEFLYPALEFGTSITYFDKDKLEFSKKQMAELEKMNHWDLSDLEFPLIKRVPDESVKREDILNGNVILVQTTGLKHKGSVVCAYKRPFELLTVGDEVVNKVADVKRRNRIKK